MKIKTRFAPSPTGDLHLGGVRTALYSWLFARKHNGKFVLRLEDTDLKRSTQQAIDGIIDGMSWLNLNWDEGPYFQSKRLDRYNAIIDKMLIQGTAYKCYCSQKRLEILRHTQMADSQKPRYDGHCRNSHDEHHPAHSPYVVRFRNPEKGSVCFNDQIRGHIEFKNQELDDLIIRRSDGSPTYNFSVVIDDAEMEITHVIRGEDHINNTPRQINIFNALNAPVPKYAHVSMILDDNGRKLSKRHSMVGIMQYRDNGFLPEAILNYLVRLGWAYGDQEIFTIQQMQQYFNLDAVSKSACTFNTDKLLWLNHYYIKHLPADYVAPYLKWHIQQRNIDTHTGPELVEVVKLFGKHYKTLKEMATNCRYLYQEFTKFDADASQHLHSMATAALRLVRKKLAALIIWTPESVQTAITQTANELEIEIGKVGMPLRVAVTGSSRSPSLHVIVHAIGQSRSLTRIDIALACITNAK